MTTKIFELDREIGSVEQLHEYLRVAMEVELSTIPAYLTALYSLKPDTNQAVRAVIQTVVIEEMLHLTLAGNVLRATGGEAMLDDRRYVPSYPTALPDSDIHEQGGVFEVPLQKFGADAITTFKRIEHPRFPDSVPDVKGWHTIGQFYDGLERGIDDLCDSVGAAAVFSGRVADQIRPDDYYGGAGRVIVVADPDPEVARANAKLALREIVDQGEGLDGAVMDGDQIPTSGGLERPMPAHFFRFDEIEHRRFYLATDEPGHPTGDTFHVDEDAVYDMRPNPNTSQYEPGSPVHAKLTEFNLVYLNLLHTLNDAFNHDRSLLMKGVGIMYELKYRAEALMRTPSGLGNMCAGPSFEFVES